jgi:protein-S-isoprenylcysteine O-methyltransferase Ste14
MSNSKAVIGSYIGVLIFACPIYIAGGRVRYWQATLYVIVAVMGATLSHLLTPKGSNLTAERASRVREGVKWDRALLGVLFLLNTVAFVVAGLDSGRFKWSGAVPIMATVAGVLLMLIGQILFALAKRANAFFSSTVRIETKRKHIVCESGPYSFVRHPGYLGMIISVVGFPLMLNSYWSFIPVAISVGILSLRTCLEDGFLKANLEGYANYALKTKRLLIPGLF